MIRRHSNVARSGSPDPILISYSGIDAAGPTISYIVCLHRRVPERYEVWLLNQDGVCEVHPTAQVKLFTLFAENTFRRAFKDIRGFCVPFLGIQSVNGSVEFLHYSDVTSDSSCHIISTQNIFVHSWGNNPLLASNEIGRASLEASS